MARAFVIHADADAPAALELQRVLERNGLEVTSSNSALRKDGVESLDDILSNTHFVISICSRHWLACNRCQMEFATVRSRGLSTFAVPLGDFQDANGVLDGVHKLDFRVDGFGQQTAADSENTATTSSDGTWLEGIPPYPGLCPYTKEWNPVFFGRDREIQKIVDHIKTVWSGQRSAIVGLVGPAGSGLSSLMRAGVLPCLGSDAILLPVLRLGATPLRAIARVLSAAVGREADTDAWASMLRTASQELYRGGS